MDKNELIEIFDGQNDCGLVIQKLRNINTKISRILDVVTSFDDGEWALLFDNLFVVSKVYFQRVTKLIQKCDELSVNQSELGLTLLVEIANFITKIISLVPRGTIKSTKELFSQFYFVIDAVNRPGYKGGYIKQELGDSIAKLFEKCYNDEVAKFSFNQKQKFGLSVLIHVLRRCLEKPVVVDFATVWKLRATVKSSFFTHDNVDNNLIERLFANDKFLANSDGLKFAASLFSLNSTIATKLHEIVKIELCNCSLNHAAILGNTYHKAWINSKDCVKETIEKDCIQNMMITAIHSDRQNQRKASNAFIHFLTQFHRKSNHMPTKKLMIKLYCPILWRALEAANCYVRENATIIVFDCFPLVNLDILIREREEDLKQQMTNMATSFNDRDTNVRIKAVKGASNAILRAVNVMPTAILYSWLKTIFERLLADSSSSKIRAASISTIRVLTHYPMVFALCKPFLHHLKLRFHDINDRVRFETCTLFVHLKEKKLTQITRLIVPLGEILNRLAEDDSEKVVAATCKLLQDVYFNTEAQDEDRLKACIRLITRNVQAARVFYTHLPRLVEPVYVCEFIIFVFKFLYLHAKKYRGRNMDSVSPDDKENADSNHNSIGNLGNPEVVCGLLNVLTLLYLQIYPWLKLNETASTRLQRNLSQSLSELDDYVSGVPVVRAQFLFMVSHLYPVPIANLAKKCIREVASSESRSETFVPCLLGIYYQGNRAINDLLDKIHRGITCARTRFEESASALVKPTKRVKFDTTDVKLELAIEALETLIRFKPQMVLEHHARLLELFNELSFVQNAIETLVTDEVECVDEVATLRGFNFFCQALLLLRGYSDHECQPILSTTMKWGVKLLRDAKDNHTRPSVLRPVLELVTKTVVDALQLGVVEPQSLTEITSFTTEVLEKNSDPDLKLPVHYMIRMFREYVRYVVGANRIDANHKDTVVEVGKILESTLRRFRQDELSGGLEDLSKLKESLSSDITYLLDHTEPDSHWKLELFASLMSTVHAQTIMTTNQLTINDFKSFRLSPLSVTMLSVLMSTRLTELVPVELGEFYQGANVMDKPGAVMAAIQVVKYLEAKDNTQTNRDKFVQVFKTINQIYLDKIRLFSSDSRDVEVIVAALKEAIEPNTLIEEEMNKMGTRSQVTNSRDVSQSNENNEQIYSLVETIDSTMVLKAIENQ